jgi:DNA polymerase-2
LTVETETLNGWLLDVYEHPEDGIVVWLLGNDGNRYRLRQHFPVTFYASGPFPKLRRLWKYLEECETPLTLARVQRRDLFSGMVEVLAASVPKPAQFQNVFYQVKRIFPDLTWYDVDIPTAMRYAAASNVFPMAKIQVEKDEDNWIHGISLCDSPWELDPVLPPIKILRIRPNTDPFHTPPEYILIQLGKKVLHLPLHPIDRFLIQLASIFKRYDPDLILSQYGDTWLFPLITRYCEENKVRFFNPNRDLECQVLQREARSFFTYGQTLFRGQQTHLFGRWHIDECNAMMYGEYGLEGVIEQARVTGIPIQEAARKSPGAGITALQIIQALKDDILVPYQKQQAETFKSTRQLITGDRGGLVSQPIVGLHQNVAEIDFVSMYPSIMVNFNISPETVGTLSDNAAHIPEMDIPIDRTRGGFIPKTLKPLIEKRIGLKKELKKIDPRDCRYSFYKGRIQALKWLLVVCFGYLGYKNARFGRIESHMAVTAYSRECLLQAKEAAEDLGYRVLYLYVDGLWVQKEGINEDEINLLLDEITSRTGLPIAQEGIYDWIAFLPSRVDDRIPVANRYFGVFRDGRIKTRGIETRRRDTPPWIFNVQTRVLERLASLKEIAQFPALLPTLVEDIQQDIDDLYGYRIPIEDLTISQTLSRELEAYRVPSPSARAALQLQQSGKDVRPGQRIRFLYTLGKPGVYAWNSPEPFTPEMIDLGRYRTLLLRAVHTVLGPFGVDEWVLQTWLLSNAAYGAPVGVIPTCDVTSPLMTRQLVPAGCPVG